MRSMVVISLLLVLAAPASAQLTTRQRLARIERHKREYAAWKEANGMPQPGQPQKAGQPTQPQQVKPAPMSRPRTRNSCGKLMSWTRWVGIRASNLTNSSGVSSGCARTA